MDKKTAIQPNTQSLQQLLSQGFVFRSMVGSSQTLSSKDLVSDVPREAAPSFHGKLLEEQQAVSSHPLLDHWDQPHSDGPASLLFQRLFNAQWLHTQSLLHDFPCVR